MRKFLIMLFVLALMLAGCGGTDSDTTTDTDTAATAAAATETSTTEGAGGETADETASETTAATTEAPEVTEAAGNGFPAELAAAFAMSDEETSFRVEGEMLMQGIEGMPGGEGGGIRFFGEFDGTTGYSSMVMDMSDLAGSVPGEDDIPEEFADLFSEMEVRTIGDTSYLKFGLLSLLGVTTEWISLPTDEANATASGLGASPGNPSDLVPALSDLVPGTAEVETVGAEDVRGVSTTHFRMVLDAAAALEAGNLDDQSIAEALQAMPGDGDFPVDFWIGDDGRIYRLRMGFEGLDSADAGFESMAMTWDFFDYGANIEIVPPPADQVTDGSALEGMLSGLTGG